jgi:hypothetical protein
LQCEQPISWEMALCTPALHNATAVHQLGWHARAASPLDHCSCKKRGLMPIAHRITHGCACSYT